MRNPGCTHAALSQLKYTAQEACLKIGLDMCATGHYLNMYETYYCRLQQSKALYIFFAVAAFAYLLVTLNYIRRTYYIQHIQKLRRILKLPDFVAESILLPVSYGVVPIFIRILASINRLAFSFHTGANIGACFNLITLFTGLCALNIDNPPKVDMQMFTLNAVFVILGNLLHIPLGIRKVINMLDSMLYFLIFFLYMMCRWYFANKAKQIAEIDITRDKVEGRVKLDNPNSVVKTIEVIVYSLRSASPILSSEAIKESQSEFAPKIRSRRNSRELQNTSVFEEIQEEQDWNNPDSIICAKVELSLQYIAETIGSGFELKFLTDTHLEQMMKLPEGKLCSLTEQEKEALKAERFSLDCIKKLDKMPRNDRSTIAKYVSENQTTKSPLLMGWEVAELTYQNERKRSFWNKRFFGKVMSLLYLPIEVVTYFIMIPSVKPEDTSYPKIRLLFNPLFNSICLAYILSGGSTISDFPFQVVFFVSLCTSGYIIYPVVFQDKIPTASFFKLIFLNNLVMSLICFYMCADVIVDLFQSLHILFNFGYSFFAVSIFSTLIWIPAINGAIKTTKYMNFIPGYNGAIFNTLFVFGLCMSAHDILRGTMVSHMWPLAQNPESDLGTFFFVLNSLVFPTTFYLLKRNGFHYTKGIGIGLTATYFIVTVVVFLLGLYITI